MKSYDVAVIGGGPGGYVAAIKAAQNGKKVCLLEKGSLGGTCLNQGCIPTKALLKSAQVLNTIRNSEEFGIIGLDLSTCSLDMDILQQRKKGIVNRLTGGVGNLLKTNGVEIITGSAAFEGPNSISVGNERIEAKNIIIATGSVPAKLRVPISEGSPVITSEEALSLMEIPQQMVVIGGGVIGVELAFLFNQLGAGVTIIEVLDRILPMVDEEIADKISRDLEKQGITIKTGSKVIEINGRTVFYDIDGRTESAEGDRILVSVGRIPNISGLNIENIGLRKDKKAIDVNGRMQTSIPGIYAIGDVTGRSMLAHTASMEGIVAVKNICGEHAVMNYDRIPQCIYLQPEVASVGATETQARAQNEDIKVGRFPLAANGKAGIEGETKGLIKVIIDAKYNEILGVHIYGIHATDLIGEMVLAMVSEATADDVAMAVHPHPTISEIIPEAFHAALGKAIHA